MTTDTSSDAGTRCPECGLPVMPAIARCRECGTSLAPRRATPAAAVPAAPDDGGPGASEASGFPDASHVLRMKCRCGRKFRVKPDWAGRSLKCPRCERTLKVPETLKENSETTAEPDVVDFKRLAERAEAELAKSPPPLLRRTLSLIRFRKLRQGVQQQPAASGKTQQVRKDALRQLGASRDARALELILAHAADPAPEVREAVAIALGELQHPAAVPPLLRMLDDEVALVRHAAVAALGKTTSRLAVRPLLLYARHEPQMRFLACDSVLQLGEAAAPELLEIVTRNESALLLDAVILLGRLGDKRAAKAILALLNLRLPTEVRRATAEALGQLGEPRGASALRALLRDGQPEVRTSAVAALVKIPDGSNVAALIEALQDEFPGVAVQAAAALGEIGERSAVPHLLKLLRSDDEALRLSAAEAMAKMGDEHALPTLLNLLETGDEKTLLRALSGLKRLNDARAIEPLLAMLEHERSVVRQRVIDVLGHIGDAEVAERLEVVLKSDRSDEVRAAAARALGEIADPVSVNVLLDALRDDFAVRCRACIALGAIGDESAMSGLMAMLKDPAPEVRFHAAAALGALGSSKAVPALKQRLEDEDTMARRGILKALEELGEPQDEKALDRRHRWRRSKDAAIAAYVLLPSSPRAWGILAGAAALVVALLGLFFWPGNGTVGATGGRVVVRANVASVSFGADGTRLAVGRTRGLVELWDVTSKSVSQQALLGGQKGVALAANGTCVAVTAGNGLVFWKVGSTDAPVKSPGHEQPIDAMSVTAGSEIAATYSRDGVVTVWDLNGGRALSAVQLPSALTAFAVSPEGDLVASGSSQGEVRLWRSDSAELVQELRGLVEPVTALAFSGDGASLAAVSPKKVVVWKTASGERTAEYPTGQPATLLAFHPDSQRLGGAVSGAIQIWDLTTGEATKFEEPKKGEITTFDFDRDGKQLAAGGEESSPVWIYDVETGRISAELDVKGS